MFAQLLITLMMLMIQLILMVRLFVHTVCFSLNISQFLFSFKILHASNKGSMTVMRLLSYDAQGVMGWKFFKAMPLSHVQPLLPRFMR